MARRSSLKDASPSADGVVLFGATGDLAAKKLYPALYGLGEDERVDIPVIGVSSSDWSDEQLRERARESIEAAVDDVEAKVLDRLLGRLTLPVR